MKGTLFSADFIKDRGDNLRLLELNTDTAFTSGALAHVNYSGLIDIISSSNINEMYVIYKDYFHRNFVTEVSKSVSNSGYITSFTAIEEDLNTIYPTAVADSSSRFILRLAYDESAIFDSTYCRQKDAIYKLFSLNSDSGSVAEFFLSSSGGEYFDNLYRGNNTDILPDVVVKDVSEVHNSLGFYKIKGTGSVEQNFESFINQIGSDKLVTNYYEHSEEPKHKAYRSFNIIYGSNLDILNLADVETEAILSKPSSIVFDTSSVSNVIDKKHYYEFTSNYPKFRASEYQGGVFEDVTIIDATGSAVEISQVAEGNTYKSLLVSGSPNTDDPVEYTNWFHSGSSFPNTSVTSSILVSKLEYELTNKLVSNVTTVSGSSFRVNPVQTVIVYDGEENGFKYKAVFDIDPNVDKLVKVDSSLVEVSSSVFEVLEQDHKVYVLDMEETDAFLLHDTEININLVSHNACFPAGTKILLDSGEYKNIEDISKGDQLRTFNIATSEFESGTVGSIKTSVQNKLITIETNTGKLIKSTPGHLFYTNGGWEIAGKLDVGDTLLNSIGEEVEITSINSEEGEFTVYHILNVENTFNYFAEDILVHNVSFRDCFVAGTLISLGDGDVKPIEDIQIGDEVLSFNEETKKSEVKKVVAVNSPIHNDIVTYSFSNGSTVSCTYDHPIYTSGYKLKSYSPEKTNHIYELGSNVENIQEGDSVFNLNGYTSTVESIRTDDSKAIQTYIFTVEDNHNFYANGILVHNK